MGGTWYRRHGTVDPVEPSGSEGLGGQSENGEGKVKRSGQAAQVSSLDETFSRSKVFIR